ncbi:MAG: threonylcarbamoyl-AMP synthase [Parachlamydiaceae bacterium]|nr:threonylcarbamoyl-AMP synthase [Parachlamydiaceae bacterium]
MEISLERAIELLKEGSVVAVPTETVYGLAASLSHPDAIKEIFQLKGRPSSNPLIIHVADKETIYEYLQFMLEGFSLLADAFWPGPMTLVLQANIEKVPEIVRAGLSTVAFRVPNHPITAQLLKLTGPLVMPSANLSGTPSATRIEHVEKDFGQEFPVLKSFGPTLGVESTILIYLDDEWQIIRQGALPPEVFKSVLGYLPIIRGVEANAAPLCPGQLFRHYAPKAKLILTNECGVLRGETILGFSDRAYPEGNGVICMGNSGKPEEIAENLYKVLRDLDISSVEKVFVDIDLPSEGLYATLLERLTKASL